jgi:hypothetical protein
MYILAVSFLIVIWWVALWGLLELFLRPYVANPRNAVSVYTVMILFVIAIVYVFPDIYERFN